VTADGVAMIIALLVFSQVCYWWWKLWRRFVDRTFQIIWPEDRDNR
jgi:hypothetical protein